MRAIVLALVLVAAPPAAVLAPAAEDDREYLEACLAAAGGRTAAARTTCFGQVSEVCLAQSRSGSEPPDMLSCAEREFEVWQALLDAAIARLAESEPQARMAVIDDAQTVWRDWRSARCAVYDTYDGPIYPPLAGLCRAETTSRRVVDLWKIETGFGDQ